MSYDLRTEPWLPFRRMTGETEWGPPDLIADAIHTNPIVAIASPRPDFDGALAEFLIGLLTAAYRLASESDWRTLWQEPPTREQLRAALMALPPAFDLDGDGPRFLQDFSPADLTEAELSPVQELLVEGKNDPLFIKPDTLQQLGRSAAAMALITIQSYSPAGGRGYRTSLRGGGPLTTLVDPRPSLDGADLRNASLWRHLWANVLTMSELAGEHAHVNVNDPAAIFPWLAPTRTSEKDNATTVAQANPLQCFFGMPRRMRLEFQDQQGRCDLTGREDDRLVTAFRIRGYGVQYKGWRHPLTPYYAGKAPNEWLPVHGQPGGIGWRDWYPLIHATVTLAKVPAITVSNFNQHRAERLECLRYSLHAFGFDVTNAKVRAWIDARLPAFAEPDQSRLDQVSALVTTLTEGTEQAAYALQRTVTDALYGGSDDPPGDLSFIKAALWDATENAFYDSVFRLLAPAPVERLDLQREFQKILLAQAPPIFDAHVDADSMHPEQLRRAVVARFDLVMTLSGNGKQGERFFKALGLSAPQSSRSRASTKRANRDQPA